MRLLKNLPVKSGKFAEVLRSHQRSTVSSEATAERLLSSITTQDFTGQKGGYIYKSFGMIMLLLLGFSTNGMRQQFEFREHQWDLDGQSHQSGRFASL
jgi:hypothetical protein